MRLCQRLCEHTTSCVRENTAGQMFVFAPDTSCLPRDERSKKFVPEEIKGAQRRPPHSHSAQAKRPKLIVEKEALAPRANWPLDVFVVGFGRRPASSVAASHISLPLTRTQCCFEIAYYLCSPASEIKVSALAGKMPQSGVSGVHSRCIPNWPSACGVKKLCSLSPSTITAVYTTVGFETGVCNRRSTCTAPVA